MTKFIMQYYYYKTIFPFSFADSQNYLKKKMLEMKMLTFVLQLLFKFKLNKTVKFNNKFSKKIPIS